jgi:hypothetical protein
MSAGRFTTTNLLTEQLDKLKQIATLSNGSVSAILAQVLGDYIENYEKTNGEKLKKLAELDAQRAALVAEIRNGK